MGNPQSPQTVLYYCNITIFLDVASHPKNKLTSVGVQTEAAGAVARLDSVRHAAIFSFILVSGHHVQNHKSVNKDTNITGHYKRDNHFH